MPACVLRRLASDFRLVCAIMVHLTFNGAERRKMPSPLKIGLCKRYHSETPRKNARNSLQHIQKRRRGSAPTVSRTPEQIPRGLYHAITPEQIGAAAHHISRNQYSAIRPTAPELFSAMQSAPTDTDRNRNRPPNRADRISPERSRQTGAACHGQPVPDFSRLSGHGIARPVHCSPIAMRGSAFCGFSALISVNCA